VPKATTKPVESGLPGSETMSPNPSLNIELVMKTDNAAEPQLKRTVCRFRLNLSDDMNASVEATATAAGPP